MNPSSLPKLRSHQKTGIVPWGVGVKLLVLVAFATLVIIAVQTWLSIDSAQQQNLRSEQSRLSNLYDDYRTRVNDDELAVAMLSASFAAQDDIKQLYLKGDRDSLLALLTPLFNELKTKYNIAHLYIENPDGTVFVRVHDPKQYGDNVTYRPTVAETLATHQATVGTEIDPGRLGVRSVSPLLNKQDFIGMLEVGLDYDQGFINDLQKRNTAEYRIWVSYEAATSAGLKPLTEGLASPTPELFYYASTNAIMPYAPGVAYQRVLQTGQPEIQHIATERGSWAVLLAPMRGYGNRTIGVLEMAFSRDEALAALQQSQITTVGIAAGLALLAFVLFWTSTNITVLRPLRHLTDVASRQLSGDLNAQATLKTGDEFNQLGDTFNTMTSRLRDLIDSLETRVEMRTAQLRASADVGRAASSILNTEQLLREAVKLISERFDFYYVAVFTIDESGRWAILREATGEAGQQLKDQGHALAIGGKSMVGYAIRSRKSRIALDVGAEAVRFANPLLPDTRSEIALPLIVGDRVFGALDVQSVQPAAFDENYAIVLQGMADQIAVALNTAEGYQREQARAEQNNQLLRTAIDLSEQTDRATLENRLVQSAIALLNADDAQLWIKVEDRLELKAVRTTRSTDDPRLSINQDLADQVFRAGLVLHFDSSPAQADYTSRIAEAPFRAALIVPITWQGKIAGVFGITRSQPDRPFTPDDENSAQLLATQVAVALENIALAERQQRTLDELNIVNRRLTGEAWRAYSQAVGTVRTVDAAPGVQADNSEAASTVSRAITLRGEVIGELSLQQVERDRTWTADEVTLLQAVANEVAVAVENARLIEETENRARREARLSRIAQRLRQATDIDLILQTATEELSLALDTSHAQAQLGKPPSSGNGH